MAQPNLVIHPLTPDRWGDFKVLFGKNGACGGCWCTVWRRPRADFENGKGPGNRRFMLNVVTNGPPPGLLAYLDGEPVGWVAVAPRSDYPALARSRVLQAVDNQPVWSVSCLFVRKDHRKKGLSVELLKAAAAFAAEQGASIVEGYPVVPKTGEVPPVFAWTGLLAAFEAAGYVECARRSPTRPIVRRAVTCRT